MGKRTFRDLSRRERLYRFRQLAKNALRGYGLESAELRFLQYGENVIYRVDSPNGPFSISNNTPYVPDRYLVRLHAWNEPEYINSEMIWLDALANNAKLPAPMPLRTLDGDYILKISDPDLGVSRWVTLLSWVEGRKMNKGLRPMHLSALGRMVAKLHNFSSTWQPPEGFSRPKWDWDAQLGGGLFDVGREELIENMPTQFQEPFKIVSSRAKDVMRGLGEDSDAFGLIHADLYPENVLYRRGQACPIDFEDCGYGCWIWDIAVALCTWAWKENWERMRDAFYEGYAGVRTLPEEQWRLLDLFIATQYSTMLLWASAFLAHDPGRSGEYVPWRDDSGNRLLNYFSQG
jgi:Ser/Thr protein kinase RdoA (MazF antagonist)